MSADAQHPGPVPDALARLLAREQMRPAESETMQSRVRARVEATLSHTGGGDPRGGGHGETIQWPRAPHLASAERDRSRAMATLRWIGVVLGSMAAGAWLHAQFAPTRMAGVVTAAHTEPVSSATVSSAQSVTRAEAVVSATIEPMPRAPMTAAAPVSTHAASPALVGALHEANDDYDDGSAAERARLEAARSAIARGDGASALAVIEEHGRRFSSGRLVEQREALRVQALVVVRRDDDARDRAARFHARFPHSLFGPAVDAALRSIP